MDNKRNYYLFVPIDNIYNKITKKDEVIFENRSAKQIFMRHNVPLMFHKIIIKVNVGGITEPTDAFECLTNKLFVFKRPFLKALLNPCSNPVIELKSKDMLIVTDNHLSHADSVKDFYQRIIDNNLASNYKDAVREIFDLPLEKEHEGIFTRIKKKKFN